MHRVVCLHTGDKYPADYPEKLYRGVARNTTAPFDFEVIRESQYPGWWGKLEQFGPQLRTIMLDIDIVITGNIDFLFEYEGQFCAWKDPWRRGLNGSIHSIAPGFGKVLKAVFRGDPDKYMRQYESDQDFLNDYTVPDYWPAGLIKSYKAHGMAEGPRGARIVVFHGNPKPHEINSGWIKEYWT